MKRASYLGFFALAVASLAACPVSPETDREHLGLKVGSFRPIEGRLSVGFEYSRFVSLNPPPSEKQRQLLAAFIRRSSHDPLASLLLGKVDLAVEGLEKQVAERPLDAPAWSDKAAAHLAQGTERPLATPQALEAALHSLEIDPKLPEARFNVALALERLGLSHEAREAWSRFLEGDGPPGWAAEAEEHLDRLARPIGLAAWSGARNEFLAAARAHDSLRTQAFIRQYSQPVRQLVEEELLPAWGRAVLSERKVEAAASLDLARFLGIQLAQVGGDHMAEDSIAAIERALSQTSRDHIIALAHGHAKYGAALPALTRHELNRACPLLTASRRELDQGGSPFSGCAFACLSSCALEQQEFHREFFFSPKGLLRYPVLSSRLRRSTGLERLAKGDPSGALAIYQAVVATFEQLGEKENVAQSRANLAETFHFLGADDQAWHQRMVSLAALPWLSPRRRASVIEEAAQALGKERLHRAALVFRRANVRECDRIGDPASRAAGRQALAESLIETKQAGDARSMLATANRWARQVDSEPLRARIQADLAVVGSRVVSKDAVTDIERLTRAIDFYSSHDNHFPMAALYLARGRARRTIGDLNRALSDFQAGIGVVESVRAKLPEDPLRLSYFAVAPELFDETLLALEQLGRPIEALEWAERARARVLFDRLSAEVQQSPDLLPPKEIAALLPEDLALIEYASLDDRLLAWVIRRDGVFSFSIPIGRDYLQAGRERLDRAIRRSDRRAFDLEAEGLYRVLIAPLFRRLASHPHWIFVPDAEIQGLPFAALRDSRSGRYLVEDRASAVAPSANVFLRCRTRLSQLGSAPPRRYLLVGEPILETRAFPTAVSLPGARREVEVIASLYPETKLLSGPEATISSVKKALGSADGFHFAGHSFLNPQFPLLARLAFAPENGKDGSLFAHDIDDLPLRHLRLVILSSCLSASGPSLGGEGVLSLARPFLAAGVPQVIGSLQNVEDERTSSLAVALHRRLAEGIDPLEALRGAQVELLRLANSDLNTPKVWGLLELFGGV